MTKVLLRDVVPHEVTGGEYVGTVVYDLLDMHVTAEFTCQDRDTWRCWPGREKHVACWWMLDIGLAVAWNENPSKGWSFPVLRITDARRAKLDLTGRYAPEKLQAKVDARHGGSNV